MQLNDRQSFEIVWGLRLAIEYILFYSAHVEAVAAIVCVELKKMN
jgi:hypothetical protein